MSTEEQTIQSQREHIKQLVFAISDALDKIELLTAVTNDGEVIDLLSEIYDDLKEHV